MGKPFNDLTGKAFGKLSVVRYLGRIPGKTKPYWQCCCECGNSKQVTTSNLVSLHTQSCGCINVQRMQGRRVYDKAKASEYGIWRAVVQRTQRPTTKNKRWYVGVPLHPTWLDSFEAFYADMGPRPSPMHSIERKDNTKGYTPDNCVWATPKEQANNRATNHVIEYSGQRLTLSQWSAVTGISAPTLLARIDRYGWSIERALSTPTKTRI